MSLSWNGDAHPTRSTDFPSVTADDSDGDGSPDFINANGHKVFVDGEGIDTSDPTGGAGLAWDAQILWRFFAGPYPIIVGDTGNGWLDMYASVRWMPTHIGFGWEPGSHGRVVVSGPATHLCNDRDIAFTPDYRTIIALAREEDPSSIVFNHLYQGEMTSEATFILQPPGHYNLWCGRKGRCTLEIKDRARVTVDHRLFVGCYETADEGGSEPYPFEADPENPIVKAMAIDGPGDLETLVHGEGGVIVINDATLSVSGMTPDNSEPYPPEKTDGTSEENERYNQYRNTSALTPVAAFPSVIGEKGVVSLVNGILRAASGLNNHGVIVAETGTIASTIATTTLINERLIHVKEGASLLIEGDLENNGMVYLEPGSKFDVTGATTGTGRVERYPCGVTSFDLRDDEINIREAAARAVSAR